MLVNPKSTHCAINHMLTESLIKPYILVLILSYISITPLVTIPIYIARHSQATVMKRAGVSTAVIREIMGHSSERVTQIYLDSFYNEQVNNALKSL